MPKITYRGSNPIIIGAEITVRLGFSTVGAVWHIVNGAGRMLAKARVVHDYGKDGQYTTQLFIDERREVERPGGDRSNLAKRIYRLKVENVEDQE